MTLCGAPYRDRRGERWYRCTVRRGKPGHIHHGVFFRRALPLSADEGLGGNCLVKGIDATKGIDVN